MSCSTVACSSHLKSLQHGLNPRPMYSLRSSQEGPPFKLCVLVSEGFREAKVRAFPRARPLKLALQLISPALQGAMGHQ